MSGCVFVLLVWGGLKREPMCALQTNLRSWSTVFLGSSSKCLAFSSWLDQYEGVPRLPRFRVGDPTTLVAGPGFF